MVRQIFVAVLVVAVLPRYVLAELEGILFSIPYMGNSTYHQSRLNLSNEQKSAFNAFRLESRAELSTVYKPIRTAWGQVRSETDRKKWSAQYGPTIRQINYDLWQQACAILETDDKIDDYFRMLLQDYLYTSRDVLCIASLLGIELTWSQFEELKSKIGENQKLLDNLLSARRREIEAQRLVPYLAGRNIETLRGEEFRWRNELEDQHMFGPEEELMPDNTLMRIANHPEVLEELKADDLTRQKLALAELRTSERRSPLELLGEAETPEDWQKLLDRKVAAEQKQAATLRACLSKEQYQRLLQIAFQCELRRFRYAKALAISNIEIDLRDQRKLEDHAHHARQQYQFARAQLSIDLNARSFDEVANTKLASSIGKLMVFTQATHHRNVQDELTAVGRYGDRYGKEPTEELNVPAALTTAPKTPVVWNGVRVPDGWNLDDAMANLQAKRENAEQTADAFRRWSQGQQDLHNEISQARRNGDAKRAKDLQLKYSREYGGRAYFEVRQQFRRALEIAQEDIVNARRIVKQLGGDPGEATDWRRVRF